MRSATQANEREQPFQLRGNSFTMMVLKLVEPGDPDFFPLLQGKIQQAPNFFRNAPVVLDLDELPPEYAGFDFGGLCRRLRDHKLIPVGTQGGDAAVQEAARAAGLPAMPAGRVARAEPVRSTTARAEPEPARTAELPYQKTSLIVTEPVRSGRQVYAARGDLIVLAPVSAGAELLADGNIHVYGALRGRALAGITGDDSARIFCHQLEAELVSIAGLYRVSEDIEEAVRRKPVQIFLDGGYLRMEALV